MSDQSKPLSPHIQIYRWQITMVMSIFHRATGILLTLATVPLAIWLLAAAGNPDLFADMQAFFASTLGQVLLIAWAFFLYYHLCNGIRHLFWDAGKGFELSSAYLSGYFTWVAAVALTALTWLLV